VYKGLDVLSNKTSIQIHAKEFGVPLHMVDIVSPSQDFSMAAFCELGKPIIQDMYQEFCF
jgi:tRNA A37 N6-isopentenylltransferase MiaA